MEAKRVPAMISLDECQEILNGELSPGESVAVLAHLLQELILYYRHALVGQRLRGLIHTLNTPLQVLLMQSELMARKLQEEEEALYPQLPTALIPAWQSFFDYRRRKNQQLLEVAEEIQVALNWLKSRTRPDNENGLQEIDLNELIKTELQGYQLEPFFKNRVVIRWQTQDRLPPISGYYGDFSQSFCHLVDNALDALQEVAEPILTLGTAWREGNRVITVGDNGSGIPPQFQPRLFLPFFTTKKRAGNPRPGLGLFFAKKLLGRYGGSINFASQPGQTQFHLVLPGQRQPQLIAADL